jgi:hypothetical protein
LPHHRRRLLGVGWQERNQTWPCNSVSIDVKRKVIRAHLYAIASAVSLSCTPSRYPATTSLKLVLSCHQSAFYLSSASHWYSPRRPQFHKSDQQAVQVRYCPAASSLPSSLMAFAWRRSRTLGRLVRRIERYQRIRGSLGRG